MRRTIYSCDICLKDKSLGSLDEVEIPVKAQKENGGYYIDIRHMDVCSECKEKIAQLVKDINDTSIEALRSKLKEDQNGRFHIANN